jgi:hypothetical protein
VNASVANFKDEAVVIDSRDDVRALRLPTHLAVALKKLI